MWSFLPCHDGLMSGCVRLILTRGTTRDRIATVCTPIQVALVRRVLTSIGCGERNRTAVIWLMRPSWNHLQSTPRISMYHRFSQARKLFLDLRASKSLFSDHLRRQAGVSCKIGIRIGAAQDVHIGEIELLFD
jgi:hypothetical protein